MARALTGSVVARPGGRFQASIRITPGRPDRHYEMFDTKAQASAWCALAAAAITAGAPLPSRDTVLMDTDPSRKSRAKSQRATARPPRVSATVEQVADAWFHEVYIDGRSGGADRANTVRSMLNRRVVPFLQPIFDAGKELSRDEYRTYLGDLGRPSSVHDGRRGPKTSQGLTQDTLSDVRRCLDGVIKLGIAIGEWKVPFDLADVRTPRSRRKPAPKSASLTLTEVARIAEHMHPVHQLTLWTCRIMTLRLGEAYGIRVEDLVPLDDGSGRGLLWLHAQGGRKFRTFDGEDVVRTFHQEGMKHGYSERMQLVPAQLMRLFDQAVDVFHTDRTTGRVNKEARLVPGLVASQTGGQQTFRVALKRAAAEAGVTTVTLNGFSRTNLGLPTPKDLRSSAVTDLEWVPGLDPTALRRYAGHAPGTDVHALHYVIDQPVNEKLVRVCAAMEGLIDKELPSGLVVPTAKRCTTRTQPILASRAAEIDTRLIEIGWLISGDHDSADPWLSVEEVADFLGLAPTTVRRWVREGRLTGTTGKSGGGTGQGHRIRRTTAVDFASTEMSRVSLTDMEERTGVSYHRLYNWVRRFDLPTDAGCERFLYLPEQSIAAIVELVELERRLQQEGVSFAEAARALGVQARTIDARVQMGTLDEVAERGPDGTRYITRVSLERVLERPELMTTRRSRRRGR